MVRVHGQTGDGGHGIKSDAQENATKFAAIFDTNCRRSACTLVGNFDDLPGLDYILCLSEAIANSLKCRAYLDGEKVN